jgi:hypothetical protein
MIWSTPFRRFAVILEEFRIVKRPSWEAKALEYKGTIKYEGRHGVIELHLNHDLSLRLLSVIADSMVDSSKELAHELTRSIIDAVPALPNPEAPAI